MPNSSNTSAAAERGRGARSESACWRTRLLAALRAPAPGAPPPANAAGGARRAGVLIPVVGAAPPFIYFTQRSDALRHHAGQISFPGGSVEAFDASVEAAALRETREEIGLDPAAVEILGELPVYTTGTGFAISAFVGWVDPDAGVAADGREVARVFGVPLTHALDHRNFCRYAIERDGRARTVYSIDYAGSHIWGATAAMLYALLARLAHAENRAIGCPRAPDEAGDGQRPVD